MKVSRRFRIGLALLTLAMIFYGFVILTSDIAEFGDQAEGGLGSILIGAGYALLLSLGKGLKRYFSGISKKGLPNQSDDISPINRENLDEKCRKLLENIESELQNLLTSGLVYSTGEKVWKVVLVGGGVGGVLVSVIIGPAVAAIFSAPGIADAFKELLSEKDWEHWEANKGKIERMWQNFLEKCIGEGSDAKS